MRVAGYVRVSTEEQAQSGLGLEAQRRTVELACEARGWEIAEWYVDDGYSAKPGAVKPALVAARKAAIAGEIDGIVGAKLDRFCRSTVDTHALLSESQRENYALVFLDLGVDTTTAGGKLVVQVIAAVAEWERDVISERTKAALAVRKSQGVRLGRPRQLAPETEGRIRFLRSAAGGGHTVRGIALALNAEGIPTVNGRPWSASTVHDVLSR